MTISTWCEFPTLTNSNYITGCGFHMHYTTNKMKKSFVLQKKKNPQFTILDPQTSLPYVKIGLFIKSKRFNNISGGISPIAWTLLFIAKVAFSSLITHELISISERILAWKPGRTNKPYPGEGQVGCLNHGFLTLS